jgi:hypothetical protein
MSFWAWKWLSEQKEKFNFWWKSIFLRSFAVLISSKQHVKRSEAGSKRTVKKIAKEKVIRCNFQVMIFTAFRQMRFKM